MTYKGEIEVKFFLISNDEDTLVGMRLAGIEGKYVSGKDELISTLEETGRNRDTGIVLINTSLAATLDKELIEFKKNSHYLIVEIPDKDGKSAGDGITKYVRDAIGLKI